MAVDIIVVITYSSAGFAGDSWFLLVMMGCTNALKYHQDSGPYTETGILDLRVSFLHLRHPKNH